MSDDLSKNTLAGLKAMGITIPYLKSGAIDYKTLNERVDAKIKKPSLLGRMMGRKK